MYAFAEVATPASQMCHFWYLVWDLMNFLSLDVKILVKYDPGT